MLNPYDSLKKPPAVSYEVRIDPFTGKEVVVVTDGSVKPLPNLETEYNDAVGFTKLIEYFSNLSFDGIRQLCVNRRFHLNRTSIENRREGFLAISAEPLKYKFYVASAEPYVVQAVEVCDSLFEYENKYASISTRPDYLDESACKKMENKYFELIEAIENSLEASWEDILKNMV